MTLAPDALTVGALLGGRVKYSQPAQGYRTGIEPVLLAASVAARPGERVIEAGTGAGAALLCLRARLPGVACHGIERDADLASLARANMAQNDFGDVTIEAVDVTLLPAGPRFQHAIANPPWHDAASTASSDGQRDAAKRARPGLLADWAAALAGCLHRGGGLTMVLPATSTAAALAAMDRAGCGSPAVLPLWPYQGQAARLILVRAVKGGRGSFRLLAGLALHEAGGDGGYSAAARAILWDGAAIAWE